MEAICAAGSPPFDPRDAPALTRDPEDDPIVYMALLSDADLLVSDDRDIVPDRIERHYEHEGRLVTALTSGELMESRLGPLGIDFDQIEGAWLRRAYASWVIRKVPATEAKSPLSGSLSWQGLACCSGRVATGIPAVALQLPAGVVLPRNQEGTVRPPQT